jgi:hypothetical protein
VVKGMAKPKNGKKALAQYPIKGTRKVVKAGDTVFMRTEDAEKPPYIAKVEKLYTDTRGYVKVRVRWYYRPEESMSGRKQFHGQKEVFLSDHYDIQSADTIEGKCIVHSFKNYTKLESVGADDYFCRFEYKATTGGFTPDRVAVYCKCEMPYNPDHVMLECGSCKDWFHRHCVGLSSEEVSTLDKYMCPTCAPDNSKKSNGPLQKTPDAKPEAKRQRR